ncbi:S1/P1 nuclease [Fulvivirga sedimenti]|uniref:S1/P1 nuclease n=1 Tax=Fulvivirga sedimenti TaxID=2879465 RepID=A0A9X1HV32_9BACT|nr:S1/P1 nuclease [Fulvivirga sedimenti]MCA6075540.1 S1/P1 nuclease [Fulvivirga sedimenti]MCA6076717.1 S1/P1 nuclease [Fulvivirga sedimenti]MCA6077845.1 S1/P1 nuclease [Fulvivirga sedimenti]
MKKLLILILSLSISLSGFGWGQTGHRAIGKIASKHLSKRTKRALAQIMGHESLAIASTWMDEVRSDDQYDYMTDWHWVTIPDGMTYEQAEKNPNGDIIATIERLIDELKAGHETMSIEKQKEYIRILTHLIGDIHQPLHVGTGLDRGGNDARVTWFWNTPTNLHSVWDSRIINEKELSYTELAEAIDHTSKEVLATWQAATVRDWAYESMTYRKQVYDIPEDGQLNYKYVYDNWGTVQYRLHQAGIRLAGVLNAIYG